MYPLIISEQPGMIGGMARVKDLYGKVCDAHTAEGVRADGLVDKPGTPTNRTGGAVWGLKPHVSNSICIYTGNAGSRQLGRRAGGGDSQVDR
jgi:hypothetical protein